MTNGYHPEKTAALEERRAEATRRAEGDTGRKTCGQPAERPAECEGEANPTMEDPPREEK